MDCHSSMNGFKDQLYMQHELSDPCHETLYELLVMECLGTQLAN